jgi:hypothetical protein
MVEWAIVFRALAVRCPSRKNAKASIAKIKAGRTQVSVHDEGRRGRRERVRPRRTSPFALSRRASLVRHGSVKPPPRRAPCCVRRSSAPARAGYRDSRIAQARLLGLPHPVAEPGAYAKSWAAAARGTPEFRSTRQSGLAGLGQAFVPGRAARRAASERVVVTLSSLSLVVRSRHASPRASRARSSRIAVARPGAIRVPRA